jgi:hypothetical protein
MNPVNRQTMVCQSSPKPTTLPTACGMPRLIRLGPRWALLLKSGFAGRRRDAAPSRVKPPWPEVGESDCRIAA